MCGEVAAERGQAAHFGLAERITSKRYPPSAVRHSQSVHAEWQHAPTSASRYNTGSASSPKSTDAFGVDSDSDATALAARRFSRQTLPRIFRARSGQIPRRGEFRPEGRRLIEVCRRA